MSRQVVRQKIRVRGRDHRTLSDRLTVLAPDLARRVGALFLRLPARSRLRRMFVARLFSSAYDAVNRRDYRLLLSQCHPEAEFIYVGEARPPDAEETYHGHAGGMAFMRGWFEGWDELHVTPAEVIDAGDGRFIVAYHMRGRGAGSGLELDVPGAQVFTVRDGVAVRLQTFVDREDALPDALAEVGLSEEADATP